MKRTYPIKQGEDWNLSKKFKTDFGYPTYHEELVIYIESKDNFNITLNRKGLTWSWADDKIEREGKYKKHNHYFTTNLKDLKEKILFITKYYGNRGHISIAPVFSFFDNETNIIIEMRPKSLIGGIISIIIPDDLLYDENNKERFSIFFDEQIKPHLGEDLLKKTNKLKNVNEEFICFNISESPILNTKIIDFCKKNGIMNPFKKTCTYRDILSSKSNNYGNYEDLFYQMTEINLLSTTEHCSLPKAVRMKRISIIIPCYNTELTINKVLKSIQYQNIEEDYFNNIEVIIIDDNSSAEISKFIDVNSYKFKIQIIRLNHNHGISHARQLGVTHATGDILIFIDSDVILSKNYLSDHLVRNVIIDNVVFVSFKENVSQNEDRISDNSIEKGIELPNYSKDLRIYKKVDTNAIGSYNVNKSLEINILEETNYFKDFHGSRVFGVYDLSCMVTGHNFSIKRDLVLQSSPFSKMFKGWGMEDVYFGLKMISNGNYIIPILSCGVYHIDHPPRSGSDEKKKEEYIKNTEIINQLLDSIIN